MKQHFAHIQKTLMRKQLAEESRDEEAGYEKYMKLVEQARSCGHSNDDIIEELENEKFHISMDHRPGDPLFLHGVSNAKTACVNAINRVIEELEAKSK